MQREVDVTARTTLKSVIVDGLLAENLRQKQS